MGTSAPNGMETSIFLAETAPPNNRPSLQNNGHVSPLAHRDGVHELENRSRSNSHAENQSSVGKSHLQQNGTISDLRPKASIGPLSHLHDEARSAASGHHLSFDSSYAEPLVQTSWDPSQSFDAERAAKRRKVSRIFYNGNTDVQPQPKEISGGSLEPHDHKGTCKDELKTRSPFSLPPLKNHEEGSERSRQSMPSLPTIEPKAGAHELSDSSMSLESDESDCTGRKDVPTIGGHSALLREVQNSREQLPGLLDIGLNKTFAEISQNSQTVPDYDGHMEAPQFCSNNGKMNAKCNEHEQMSGKSWSQATSSPNTNIAGRPAAVTEVSTKSQVGNSVHIDSGVCSQQVPTIYAYSRIESPHEKRPPVNQRLGGKRKSLRPSASLNKRAGKRASASRRRSPAPPSRCCVCMRFTSEQYMTTDGQSLCLICSHGSANRQPLAVQKTTVSQPTPISTPIPLSDPSPSSDLFSYDTGQSGGNGSSLGRRTPASNLTDAYPGIHAQRHFDDVQNGIPCSNSNLPSNRVSPPHRAFEVCERSTGKQATRAGELPEQYEVVTNRGHERIGGMGGTKQSLTDGQTPGSSKEKQDGVCAKDMVTLSKDQEIKHLQSLLEEKEIEMAMFRLDNWELLQKFEDTKKELENARGATRELRGRVEGGLMHDQGDWTHLYRPQQSHSEVEVNELRRETSKRTLELPSGDLRTEPLLDHSDPITALDNLLRAQRLHECPKNERLQSLLSSWNLDDDINEQSTTKSQRPEPSSSRDVTAASRKKAPLGQARSLRRAVIKSRGYRSNDRKEKDKAFDAFLSEIHGTAP
ncbi:MAG: hypothetical protein M1837_006038 [Sclerophora amabilis]|nr:MAG: hypothetical protein M1837_006038 [Sclerophora amabilis]